MTRLDLYALRFFVALSIALTIILGAYVTGLEVGRSTPIYPRFVPMQEILIDNDKERPVMVFRGTLEDWA